MNHQWTPRRRPARLERRYEFADYDKLRDFLDAAADHCEQVGLYPDMNFTRERVNATLHTPEGTEAPGDAEHALAAELDRLAAAHQAGDSA